VSTYSVSFGGLSFSNSGAQYRLMEASPAQVKWRRVEITAPYVAGSQVLSEVQDITQYQLVVRCAGDSGTNAGTLVNNLKAASVALPGNLTVVLNGASETYVARPADITYTATRDDLQTNQRTVTLVFPVQPYPS
jgi:hypothetical protein